MSKAWKTGSTRWWREHVRAPVLARDGYQCQIRTPGICLTTADCVHHTLGKAVTGDDPDYCVAACTPCNLKVGDPTKAPDPQPMPVAGWW